MNVFGQLVLDLIGTGFVGGVFLTSLFWVTLFLLIKLGKEKDEK